MSLFPHPQSGLYTSTHTGRKSVRGGAQRSGFASCVLLSLALLSNSCAKPEEWSAIVHASETSLEHRTVGIYPTVQECLTEGRKQKGKGYLECGLRCKWDAQGLFNCEKVVRLMDHQLPR